MAQVPAPLRVLLSATAAASLAPRLEAACGGLPCEVVVSEDIAPGTEADVAFLSRDVTGASSKHWAAPHTQSFYDRLSGARSLRWLHVHSSGADRPIFSTLRDRGVAVTTSSGTNGGIVVQTVLGAILSLARRLPQLMQAQTERRWAPLVVTGQPPDLEGQRALIVGWGPIGQGLARWLGELGVQVLVARHSAEPVTGLQTVGYSGLSTLLPDTDWLILACPYTAQTEGLIGTAQLALLPRGAHVVNVARGEIMPESSLIEAFRSGHLAGGYIDVFEHEPLDAESPLWNLPNVIVTPHTASHSAGNNTRVERLFLDNLGRWMRAEPLKHLAL